MRQLIGDIEIVVGLSEIALVLSGRAPLAISGDAILRRQRMVGKRMRIEADRPVPILLLRRPIRGVNIGQATGSRRRRDDEQQRSNDERAS
jgi:hypothetical protein